MNDAKRREGALRVCTRVAAGFSGSNGVRVEFDPWSKPWPTLRFAKDDWLATVLVSQAGEIRVGGGLAEARRADPLPLFDSMRDAFRPDAADVLLRAALRAMRHPSRIWAGKKGHYTVRFENGDGGSIVAKAFGPVPFEGAGWVRELASAASDTAGDAYQRIVDELQAKGA